MSAHVSSKVATNDSFRNKRYMKTYIFRLFFQSENAVWNAFDQFGIIISRSATFNIGTDERTSLKVATKGSLTGRKPLKI